MPTLKEEILSALNEMPRNYSYPPDATPEKKKEIKQKVGANITDTIKRLTSFETKVKNLLAEFEKETEAEVAKIRDEETTRFGPFQSLHGVRRKLEEVLIAIDKAKTKTGRSAK